MFTLYKESSCYDLRIYFVFVVCCFSVRWHTFTHLSSYSCYVCMCMNAVIAFTIPLLTIWCFCHCIHTFFASKLQRIWKIKFFAVDMHVYYVACVFVYVCVSFGWINHKENEQEKRSKCESIYIWMDSCIA